MAYRDLRFGICDLQSTVSEALARKGQVALPHGRASVTTSLWLAGAIAGFPFGKLTKRIFRRCFFKLKSRERQLISDRMPAVRNRFPTPNPIAITLPVGVSPRPLVTDMIVCIPWKPSRP